MKPDFYTKAVLTVIAVCLLAIVGRDIKLIPTAKASNMPPAGYSMVPVNEDGSVNVRLISVDDAADMDVNIADCYGCPLDVKVKGQVDIGQ